MMAGGIEAIVIAASASALEAWTLAPSAISAWAEGAQPGEELVYARGYLTARSAAAKKVQRLRAAGLVTYFQKPPVAGEPRSYVVRRLRSNPIPLGRPRPTKAPRIDGDMARVLRVLRKCAREAKVCPTNRAIEREAGVRNASYQIQKLADAGVLASRVIDHATGTRQISFPSTEQKTALPEGWLA